MSPPRSSTRPLRLDPAAVRQVLREAGLRARRSLSQNFLTDVDVLEAILGEAAPVLGRRVLEIGPGLGILTGGLLESGAAVTAVELDSGLANELRSRFASALEIGLSEVDAPGSLILVEGDILDLDLDRLVAPPYDVVANLPYHITSPILHLLLGQPPRPDRLVLMVQREVAERIAAAPGAVSYLSVFVQYHASVRLAMTVPGRAFEPEPAVESAVVVIEPYPVDRPDRLPPDAEEDLWRLVQAGFRERRKMIHNVLARQLAMEAARVEEVLRSAGIAPDRRPQTLSVAEWRRLLDVLGPLEPDRRGRRGPRRERPCSPEADG